MNKKYNIINIQKFAIEKRGKLLSTEYINYNTKLLWECEFKHQWLSSFNRIINNRWCPICANKNRNNNKTKKAIHKLLIIIKEMNGKCLSDLSNINNFRSKILIECNEGHQWLANSNNIMNGNWCPYCNNTKFIMQERTRYIFEQLFEVKFPITHPIWLKSNKNGQLELDGYNEELKIAFEYNGVQHYDKKSSLNKNGELSYNELINHDQIKLNLCKERGIIFIVVPYKIKYFDIQQYIVQEYKCLTNIDLSSKFKIKFDNFHNNNTDKSFDIIKKIALLKNGKCLSHTYINVTTKLLFECEKGHQWFVKPIEIKKGHWCPICKGRNKTITDMQLLAKKRNGKCLSDKYINDITKLLWQCEKGHQWYAIPSSINRGTWCPYCIGRNKTIEDLNNLVKIKNGKCLSDKYINDNTKYLWQCEKGHQWYRKIWSILNGNWCPYCNFNNKITKMKEIAYQKNGKCLSDTYLGIKEKLLWQCEKGHQWYARPDHIKKGHWCPICN